MLAKSSDVLLATRLVLSIYANNYKAVVPLQQKNMGCQLSKRMGKYVPLTERVEIQPMPIPHERHTKLLQKQLPST